MSIFLWCSSISLIPLTFLTSGFTIKPHFFIFSKNSDCFEKIIGSIAPKPYAKYFKGILEVSFGSFCLKLPPAAFLGLAKLFFKFPKSLLLIYISQRISNKSGKFFDSILFGILVIVFKLFKISSPVSPSPLDKPFVNIPFL